MVSFVEYLTNIDWTSGHTIAVCLYIVLRFAFKFYKERNRHEESKNK